MVSLKTRDCVTLDLRAVTKSGQTALETEDFGIRQLEKQLCRPPLQSSPLVDIRERAIELGSLESYRNTFIHFSNKESSATMQEKSISLFF